VQGIEIAEIQFAAVAKLTVSIPSVVQAKLQGEAQNLRPPNLCRRRTRQHEGYESTLLSNFVAYHVQNAVARCIRLIAHNNACSSRTGFHLFARLRNDVATLCAKCRKKAKAEQALLVEDFIRDGSPKAITWSAVENIMDTFTS
jgi:hypothetical protein